MAWADLWNGAMSRCAGFEQAALGKKDSLPCHPSTVVYGHAASRGLDVHRWTVGLDTGCVCYDPTLYLLSRSLRFLSRSTAEGLRRSFWIVLTHTWTQPLVAFTIATTPARTMTMTTMTMVSSQAQGRFFLVTVDKHDLSASNVTGIGRRSIVKTVAPLSPFLQISNH